MDAFADEADGGVLCSVVVWFVGNVEALAAGGNEGQAPDVLFFDELPQAFRDAFIDLFQAGDHFAAQTVSADLVAGKNSLVHDHAGNPQAVELQRRRCATRTCADNTYSCGYHNSPRYVFCRRGGNIYLCLKPINMFG